MSNDEILEAALSLSTEDRATLAQELLLSLDESSDDDADDLWIDEIAKRVKELEDQTASPVDWQVARKRIADRLRKRRNGGFNFMQMPKRRCT